jgi:cytidine deaminase
VPTTFRPDDPGQKEKPVDNSDLIEQAQAVLGCRQITEDCIVGEVSAALLTSENNVYVGVSISAACGVGFCAEHSAIAHMITRGETQIAKVVAITSDGEPIPPCGRCRELLYQIDRRNLQAQVILGSERTLLLEELLPVRWQEHWS